MTRDLKPRVLASELVHAITQRIVQRTGGQIRNLKVEVTDVSLVVRGRARSFHLKQLTIQAVFDVINLGEMEVSVEVAVEPVLETV